jgi:hypothetical protein
LAQQEKVGGPAEELPYYLGSATADFSQAPLVVSFCWKTSFDMKKKNRQMR